MGIWSTATSSRADKGLLTTSATGDSDPFRYPRSHEEWVEWYQYRLDAYHGDNYGEGLAKRLQLFRALDDNGKLIATTRRLFRDVTFVVDVAVAALALDQLTLTANPAASEADAEEARRIWARSKPTRFGEQWSRTLAACGDYGMEPVRFTTGVRLVGHDPRTLYLEYDDATGTELERVVITHQLLGEATVDAYGNVSELGALTTHQRTITASEITTSVRGGDGQARADERASGPHRLGVVPFAHLCAIPFSEPEHSLWVGHGMDRALAEVDSLMSQISAVGDRFANPKLKVIGAKIGSDSEVSRFGRILNIFGGSPEALSAVQVDYLEPSMAGLSVLADRIDAMLSQVRGTLPEFLFSGSAAGLSGEALRLLATRYVAKYEGVRARVYGGIEEALGMAVALSRGVAYDPSIPPVRLSGPPLLPADVKAIIETTAAARAAGLITAADGIRQAQQVGIASDDLSAEEYLAQIQAEGKPAQADVSPGLIAEIEAARELLRSGEVDVAAIDEALREALAALGADDASPALMDGEE